MLQFFLFENVFAGYLVSFIVECFIIITVLHVKILLELFFQKSDGTSEILLLHEHYGSMYLKHMQLLSHVFNDVL